MMARINDLYGQLPQQGDTTLHTVMFTAAAEAAIFRAASLTCLAGRTRQRSLLMERRDMHLRRPHTRARCVWWE